MKNVIIFEHPLIQHKLSMLRDKNTKTKEFRELVTEIAMLSGYEITKGLPLKEVDIETPVGPARVKVADGDKICLIPILRAGLGMVDGMIRLLPMAMVGHLGLYRDKATLKPVLYYCNIPEEAADCEVVVLEPMIATGGTTSEAIAILKEKGVSKIKVLSLIASAEGIEYVAERHPDIVMFCCAIDDKLNDSAYIVPGLGDAGDRLFGT